VASCSPISRATARLTVATTDNAGKGEVDRGDALRFRYQAGRLVVNTTFFGHRSSTSGFISSIARNRLRVDKQA
jgi:hypothetical protein